MALAPAVTVVILACSIWMLVEIGFLPGTEGVEQLRTRSSVPPPEGTPFRTKSAAVPTNQGTREDAPGEDAMKLQKILFSFDGRIGRRTYWLAILALIVALTSQFIWFLGTGQSVRIAPVGDLT
jgi:uncharacterized membrane protein YhaH (DUF805 family)